MLKMVHHVTKEITKSCRYTNFLRCDVISSRCIPIHGRKLLSISTDVLGSMKIVAEVEPKKECVVEMPKVFHSIVSFVCPRGYYCKKSRTGGHCLPDCDSVFAPLKECPQSLTPIPSLVTENPDPDAPVSPREVPDEEETTVTESSDLWDDQQTTLVDKEVDSLTESLENVGNEVPNDISEPDNDKTVEPSVTEEDADNEGEGDAKNEIGYKNEIGDKNDIEGDTNSGPEDENENDESSGRVDSTTCTGNQIIIDPGLPEKCKDCPEKSTPDKDQKNCDCTDPKQFLEPDPSDPDSLGTCKDCPDGKIQDPDKRNECKCEDNKIPADDGSKTCKPCEAFQTPDTSSTPPIKCKCVDNAEVDGNGDCKCNANAYQDGNNCIACKDDQVPNDPMKPEKCSCKDKNKIPDATSGECVCADDKMEHPSDSTKCICKEANQIPNKDTNACEECPTGEMRDPNDYYKCIAVSGSCPTGQKPNPEDLNQCICIDQNQILDPMDIKKCKDCDPGKKANLKNPTMCICQSESQYLVPPDNKECKDCDTDKIADLKNPTMCICKEGYIDDGKTCTECKDGRKANADRTKCVCPDGFAAATGEICKECDKNAGFEPNGDQTECVCKPGHIPDGTPPTKCTHCSTPGHYADLTSGTCKPCDAGMVPDAQHATCGPCPAGEVPDQDNPGACKACNAGEVPDPDPANIGKCKVCEGDLKPNTNKTECECGPGMMPDPNNVCVPATTTTTPAPGPITPKPGQFIGDKCDKMCGKHQQINGVECKEGFCRCVHGAKPEIPKTPKGRPKVCRIPLDHPCILKGKETVNSKNPDNRAPIACVAGSECVPVNSGNYCRRKEENGYIVISQNEYKKLPKNGGSSLDFTLSWKQLGALVITIALTIPYNHAA
ncbi:Laminin subunit alpha-5 [Orchesella cincta]|uniref:Laminin subunit alpha-5 n=1 Tax=Orchesella cincta TaxID=48709 RepID=A0A1D2MRN1_ORCCI|nr:Laminin subunit alpha-5 [Orchesella cincta]